MEQRFHKTKDSYLSTMVFVVLSKQLSNFFQKDLESLAKVSVCYKTDSNSSLFALNSYLRSFLIQNSDHLLEDLKLLFSSIDVLSYFSIAK